MNTLWIILLVMLGILVLALCVLAFIGLTIFWTIQPILTALGKFSAALEAVEFVNRRVRRWRDRKAKKSSELP